MDVGVERLAVRGDGQETFLRQHLRQLLAGSLHALADVAARFEGAVQVIKDGKQLMHQPLRGHGEYAGALPLLALARVLELRLQTTQGVQVLVPLEARGLQLFRQHGKPVDVEDGFLVEDVFLVNARSPVDHLGRFVVLRFRGGGVPLGCLEVLGRLLFGCGVVAGFRVALVLLAAQSSLVLLWLPPVATARTAGEGKIPTRGRRTVAVVTCAPRCPPPGRRCPWWSRRSRTPPAVPGCRAPPRACGMPSSGSPACA